LKKDLKVKSYLRIAFELNQIKYKRT